MLVLIVDEDAAARDTARRSVERFGYRCAVAASGADAWQQLQVSPPNVLLVSLSLGDGDGVELCRRVRGLERGAGCYVIAVLATERGDLFGAMTAGADDFLVRPYDGEQLHARLQVAERVVLLNRHLADCQADLERLRRALGASARTDALTGLWNRLQLADDLALFQGQLERYGHRYAAAIVQVDCFDAFTSAAGQLAGEEALRTVAQTLARQLRTGDRAYHTESAELVVLLPEQTAGSAQIAVERIRVAVDSLALPHHANPPWNVLTVSAGLAAFGPAATGTYEALLARARRALGRARAHGGNRVVCAE